MTVSLRRRHAGRRARRRAGRRTVNASRSRRRARSAVRWPSGAAASGGSATGRSATSLLQARYVVGRRRGRQGGRADGEERQRLRPVPAARRVARHARVPRRRDPADPAARRVRAVVHDVRRPVGDRAARCTDRRRCCGTARRRGCCSRATRATSPTRPIAGCAGAQRSTGELPSGGRWSMRPADLASLPGTGRFVAEIGVGIVHHELPRAGPACRRCGRRAAPPDQGAVRSDRSPEPRRDGVARCTLSGRSSTRRPVPTT